MTLRDSDVKCFHPDGRFREFTTADLQSSVLACFERQVERHRNRLAAKTGDRRLTYGELSRAANQVAWMLLSEGADGPEPIALLFESAVPALAAMLGVLKAGKFYVPIELSQPRTRMIDTLRDSQACCVLTDLEHRDVAEELVGNSARLIVVDDLAGAPVENVGLSLGPETLAFVTYTSGSSSQPKGVVYDHAGILYQVYLDSNIKQISCHDRLSLVRSYSYNGAVKDIYCALLNGASLFP